ncbi:enoyl-CoA hydratase/isomerase family protein [Kitasatospora sp. NPDC048540]|uniref:enoyl-CoA hydratase/isomerase family protein n=1 Tax=unclassified Kitasatospora TaxID=2633591 RepID=UPI000A9111BA|nr:enoyl-CoA hydratase/isomerase family protein [Kitasatospora sp. MBT63]
MRPTLTADAVRGAGDRPLAPDEDFRPTGAFQRDRDQITARLQTLTHLIDDLPPRPDRTEAQQHTADALHLRARRLRRGFLARYAEHVYAELTDGLTRHPRLEQLAQLAAERHPGLVPGRERLAAEARLAQRDKEGWEVDLGIFFHAVLDSPRAGTHLLHSLLRPTPAALAALPEYRRTGRADLKLATVTRRAGIAHLELCNDAYLNAEDDAAVEALETGTDLVLLDEASHVGVLRGAPMSHPAHRGRRVFSAGINLTHLYHGEISFLGFLLRRETGYIAKFVRGLCLEEETDERWWPQADKPWVGAVDSFAIGGGLQILPTLDRVVAADDAWFSLPAMEEGLVPGVANLRLTALTGARLARRLVLWGHRLRAGDPEAALLCDETAPADAMDAAVERAAQHLDNPAVAANRRMITLGEEPFDVFRRYLAAYALEQAYRLYSADLIANLERTWISRSRARNGGGRR